MPRCPLLDSDNARVDGSHPPRGITPRWRCVKNLRASVRARNFDSPCCKPIAGPSAIAGLDAAISRDDISLVKAQIALNLTGSRVNARHAQGFRTRPPELRPIRYLTRLARHFVPGHRTSGSQDDGNDQADLHMPRGVFHGNSGTASRVMKGAKNQNGGSVPKRRPRV